MLKFQNANEPFYPQEYCAKILQALEGEQYDLPATQSCSACLLAFAEDEARE